MNEKESRISKENRMIRKANRELDIENNELKKRVKELEAENKRLDESVRALKDELFKLMVENGALKRRTSSSLFLSSSASLIFRMRSYQSSSASPCHWPNSSFPHRRFQLHAASQYIRIILRSLRRVGNHPLPESKDEQSYIPFLLPPLRSSSSHVYSSTDTRYPVGLKW